MSKELLEKKLKIAVVCLEQINVMRGGFHGYNGSTTYGQGLIDGQRMGADYAKNALHAIQELSKCKHGNTEAQCEWCHPELLDDMGVECRGCRRTYPKNPGLLNYEMLCPNCGVRL